MTKDSQVIIVNWGIFYMAVYDYAKQVARQGYPVTVICTVGNPSQTLQLDGRVKQVFLFKKTPRKWQFIHFQLKILKTIKDILSREGRSKTYLIHCWANMKIGSLPCLAKLVLPRGYRLKWIWDVRSPYVQAGFKEKLWELLFQWVVAPFDAILCIDEYLLKRLRPRIRQAHTDILPLGVDKEMFHPDPELRHQGRKALGLAEGGFIYLYGGVLEKARNLEIILQAFHLCRALAPATARLKLVMAGEGPDLPRLQAIARHLGLADEIIFSGLFPYERYPELVNAADVALAIIPMTPQYDPQPPKKTIEYLACGRPVIATDTRGNRRFIRHLENGLLTRDSAPEIAAAMTILWQEPDLRYFLSKNGLLSIEPYEMKNLGNHLCRIYEEIWGKD